MSQQGRHDWNEAVASRDASPLDTATRRYLRQAMRMPLLSRQREIELAALWLDESDEDALHELISAHVRLVAGVAARYRRMGLPMAELLQEGTIGLLQAANRFDPDRDIRFATYAGWWVKARLQDYLRRNSSVVRIGSSAMQKRLFTRLRQAGRVEDGSAGLSEAQRQSIAEDLAIDRREVELMEAVALGADRSLDATVEDGGVTDVHDLLADDGPGPEEIVIARLDEAIVRRWLLDAVKGLPEREQKIIRARYLIDSSRSLKALGEELGVSKERVRQLEVAAVARIRQFIRDRMAGEEVEAP